MTLLNRSFPGSSMNEPQAGLLLQRLLVTWRCQLPKVFTRRKVTENLLREQLTDNYIVISVHVETGGVNAASQWVHAICWASLGRELLTKIYYKL